MIKAIDYEGLVYIFIAFFFIVLFVYLGKQSIVIPSRFQCTESAVVDGVAECVKYEKRAKE